MVVLSEPPKKERKVNDSSRGKTSDDDSSAEQAGKSGRSISSKLHVDSVKSLKSSTSTHKRTLTRKVKTSASPSSTHPNLNSRRLRKSSPEREGQDVSSLSVRPDQVNPPPSTDRATSLISSSRSTRSRTAKQKGKTAQATRPARKRKSKR